VAGRSSRRESAATPLSPSQVVNPAPLGGVADLVDQIGPAVVYLSTGSATVNDLVGPNPPPGTVSGLLVDERGYVVTTKSGVANASELAVVLSDGRQFRGKVVRRSPDNDVAVVQIFDAVGLQVVSLGRSIDLRVGEPVVAIGKSLSFGGSPTVSQGVVMALHRKIGDTLDGLVETDAQIGPANAGGPLVNLAGQVVGIAVPTPAAAAGSYAIGIDSIRPFIDQVVQRRPPLTSGLRVATLTPSLAFASNIQYTRGVIVTGVTKGGPGDQAQLRLGDVITQIGGQPVETEERFIRLTVAGSSDSPTAVAGYRAGSSFTVNVTLEQVLETP
jgi:serine protease Do